MTDTKNLIVNTQESTKNTLEQKEINHSDYIGIIAILVAIIIGIILYLQIKRYRSGDKLEKYKDTLKDISDLINNITYTTTTARDNEKIVNEIDNTIDFNLIYHSYLKKKFNISEEEQSKFQINIIEKVEMLLFDLEQKKINKETFNNNKKSIMNSIKNYKNKIKK